MVELLPSISEGRLVLPEEKEQKPFWKPKFSLFTRAKFNAVGDGERYRIKVKKPWR